MTFRFENNIKFEPPILNLSREQSSKFEQRGFKRRSGTIKLKTVAVLIGYQYNKNFSNSDDHEDQTGLPGILIDLYQAYTFAMKSLPTEIMVITDIEQDQIWKETVGAMGKHIVDSGILDFIGTIRNKGIYNHHIDKKWLENKLTKLFDDADRVLFYYTGHGKAGYLELPIPKTNDSDYLITMLGETKIKSIRGNVNDEELYVSKTINFPEFIKMNHIRKMCFKHAKPNLEVLFIFDSCNSTGLGMPFKLRPDGVFRLIDKVPRDIISYSSPILESIKSQNENKETNILQVSIHHDIHSINSLDSDVNNFIMKGNVGRSYSFKTPLINPKIMKKERRFFSEKAICISSTAPRQESLSTSDGSLFTRYLFKSISGGVKSLHDIRKKLKDGCSSYSQTATIYSTYPDLIFLWKWLYGGEKKYRISVDIHNGLVILSKTGTEDNITSTDN